MMALCCYPPHHSLIRPSTHPQHERQVFPHLRPRRHVREAAGGRQDGQRQAHTRGLLRGGVPRSRRRRARGRRLQRSRTRRSMASLASVGRAFDVWRRWGWRGRQLRLLPRPDTPATRVSRKSVTPPDNANLIDG